MVLSWLAVLSEGGTLWCLLMGSRLSTWQSGMRHCDIIPISVYVTPRDEWLSILPDLLSKSQKYIYAETGRPHLVFICKLKIVNDWRGSLVLLIVISRDTSLWIRTIRQKHLTSQYISCLYAGHFVRATNMPRGNSPTWNEATIMEEVYGRFFWDHKNRPERPFHTPPQ